MYLVGCVAEWLADHSKNTRIVSGDDERVGPLTQSHGILMQAPCIGRTIAMCSRGEGARKLSAR